MAPALNRPGGWRYKPAMAIHWTNLGLLLAVTVGHAVLVVAFLNRAMARPISHRLSHVLKQTHDFVIVLLPVLLVAFYGVTGSKLLWAGANTPSIPVALPVWLVGYLLVCLVLAVIAPVVKVLRTIAGPAKALRSTTSLVVDIAREVPGPLLGEGPYRRFANVPGNQLLQVEFNEKTLVHPRLPREWDGLSILHFSDCHYIGTVQRAWYDRVYEIACRRPCDLVAFTGDLLDDLKFQEWIEPTFGRFKAPLGCWFVLGNHDWILGDTQPIRRSLTNLGWFDATETTRQVAFRGGSLVIAGSERPWMGPDPDLAGTPENAFRLLLSHTPDQIQRARADQIDLMLAGHNHGGQVRFPLFGPVYSPSVYGCRYASGVFWEEPTLLHVSRGLGGRHPLRINCRPEVTRIVLRSGG
jgi:predicted MPP superfamily phosphohydrolase